MQLPGHDPHAAILRKIAGDGKLNSEAEWAALDAADGRADGKIQLSGLSKQDQAALQAAHDAKITVELSFVGKVDTPLGWDNPTIQDAYAAFLQDRWAQWKANREEADCKTMALKMMHDFRDFYKAQTGIQVPDPIPPEHRGKWVTRTPDSPGHLPTHVPDNPAKVRKSYRKHVGKPTIAGPNHFYKDITASAVALYVTRPITERNGVPTVVPYQRTKSGEAENWMYPQAGTLLLNPEALRPGDLIFQNHGSNGQPDHRADHAMHVMRVERDPESGKVKRLVIAMGTFDDMKDSDPKTRPDIKLVNNYSLEATIEFGADGDIQDCQITWQSDPYLELMDAQNPGDRIDLGYWILGKNQQSVAVHQWK